MSSPLLCSARLRIKGGGSGGAQSGLTSEPSLQSHHKHRPGTANIPHKPDIYFCKTLLQTSDLFSDFDTLVRAGTTLQ